MAFTNDDKKHCAAIGNVLGYVSTLIAEGARVLEVGPGRYPFVRATHAVDRFAEAPGTVVCDVDQSPLPFADKEFDFVFCRHIVEDLHNPFLLLNEMGRVGKAGYIETPSPLAEIARGIDGGSPAWRGYHHHRWIVWEDDGVLVLLGKYPVIEPTVIKGEEAVYERLKKNPFLWNTYYFWEDKPCFQFLQHEIDLDLSGNYGEVIKEGIARSIASTELLLPRFMDAELIRSLQAIPKSEFHFS